MASLCRDCIVVFDAHRPPPRCPACGSARLVGHQELALLTIAHVDCDAFYASIEKRDDPTLADKPVLVGGRHRGVVAAACYVARRYGVHSAMPMFKALKACPEAVVIPPNMAKYAAVGRQIRDLFRGLTPLVEPISIDEAFLDLGGTARLHGRLAAQSLAALALRIEREIGVTVSIGLAANKFLAKLASDRDKPRGFAIIGQAEAETLLAPLPVRALWGVGAALHRRLIDDGLTTIGDLRGVDEAELVRRHGVIGHRLARFSRGLDERRVDPVAVVKSVSAETTLDTDVADPAALGRVLWRLSERVAARLKRAERAGGGVVLKLKSADFRLRTRSRRLAAPTQLAETIYQTGLALLDREATGTRFRLIGVGVDRLEPANEADPPDLLDPERDRGVRVEHAIDQVRKRFGSGAIAKGRGFAPRPETPPPPRREKP